MRTGRLALLFLPAALVGGCGSGGDPGPVALDISAPVDNAVVHEGAVAVRGGVRPPDASVLVLGRPAKVTNGQFRARVPLREGPNVIDVGASAHGAVPAWKAVRVVRQVLVKVPDLAGASRGDAVDQLNALGLRAEVDERGGLLNKLLPAEWGVCETEPQPGTELPRGARVRVSVSKTC